MERTRIIDSYTGYVEGGISVVRASHSDAYRNKSPDSHTGKFMVAAGVAAVCTAAVCIFPPAAGGGSSCV